MRARAIVKLALLGLVLALWLGPAVSVHAAPTGPAPAAGWVEWLADAWSRWQQLSSAEAAPSSSRTDPVDDDESDTVVSGGGPALTETSEGGDGEQFPGMDPNG